MKARCEQWGYSGTANDGIDETCEREVAPEVEDEKQVSKPPRPTAADSVENQALENFINTGYISGNHTGFEWAFESLHRTTLGPMVKKLNFPRNLRVTRDFARAIDADDPADSYQQHVAYVLHTKPSLVTGNEHHAAVVIVSQADVESYWKEISRQSAMVLMHCYNAKVTPEAARRTDYIFPRDVNISHTYPTDVRIALDVFAGQLYFGSYDEYVQVSSFLGLVYFDDDGNSVEVDPDGFVPPHERHKIPAWHWRPGQRWETFDASPVPFLKHFLSAVRNHGAGIEHTHMGKMLDGERLGEKEFGDGYKPRGPGDVVEEAAGVAAQAPRLEGKAQRDERMQTETTTAKTRGKRSREGSGEGEGREPTAAVKRQRREGGEKELTTAVRWQRREGRESTAAVKRQGRTLGTERTRELPKKLQEMKEQFFLKNKKQTPGPAKRKRDGDEA